jgi:acetyl/propionyl-CoA carboxylase alpha subunit
VEVRLRIGSRELTVALSPDAAVVDGVRHALVTLWTSGGRMASGASVEELSVEIDGVPCRALVARSRDRVTVVAAGRTYVFETGEERRHPGGGGTASGTVAAPMPGKVTAVLVKIGDVVEPGAPLVVLEAMKMESTLTAEVAGRVAAVAAVVGALVAAGDVLIEITPSAPTS